LVHLIKNHYKFLQLYQHDASNFKEKYLIPVILTNSSINIKTSSLRTNREKKTSKENKDNKIK